MTQRQELKTVRQLLDEVALERELRSSTRLQYMRCMTQLGILDEPVAAVTKTLVVERAWELTNVNTRRGALVAARSILGFQIKIPRAVPRRYVLPDEITIRASLMTSMHEVRGLCMAFAGLRLGEACGLTRADIRGDRLLVTKQIQTLRETGKPTITRLAPVKTHEDDVVAPWWLIDRVASLTETAKPDGVRESIRRAGDRFGVHLNPTQLRHFYATNLLEKGAPLALVSRQMRHSDVSTTLRHYADFTADRTIHELLG